jgi:DnaJ-domain-containing protein 1
MTKKSEQTRRARVGNGKNPSAQLLGPNTEIGRKLKQYYDELVSDEVPDRFADLLSKLEQAEPAGMAVAAETKAEG